MEFDVHSFMTDYQTDCDFETIFSLSEIQEIQDSLTRVTGTDAVLIDLDGKAITTPSIYSADGEEHLRKCLETVLIKERPNNKMEPFFYEIEQGQGAVVPVVVKGKYFCDFILYYSNEGKFKEPASFLDTTKAFANLVKRFGEYRFSDYQNRIRMKQELEREKKLEQERKRLQKENERDMLTGVYSRSYFESQSRRLEDDKVCPVAVVMGDVNDLKITNDLFGHRHGDYLLQRIAEVMMDEAEPYWIVGRCGGDELNVLMPGALRRDAEWYCHRVRNRLKEITDCCTQPSISMGVGKRSDMEYSIKQIISTAEIKMYREKSEYKQGLNILENIYQLLLRRGYVTEDYTKLVAKISKEFSKYTGHYEWMDKLELLSWTHELGMTIIPEQTYFKPPEERTRDENREISKHSQVGARLAILQNDTEGISEVIEQLHEQWNGRGQPYMLSGTEIRPLARMMSIVTSYCKMICSDRDGNYLEPDAAQEEIKKMSGIIYDPEMVKDFLLFLAEKQEYSEK